MSIEPAALDVTQPLSAAPSAVTDDSAELLALVCPELKSLLEAHFMALLPDGTLHAPALMDEFIIHLSNFSRQSPPSRLESRAVAAIALRRLLAEYAAAPPKGTCRVQLFKAKMAEPRELKEILALHHLLDLLAGQDARMAKVVELRYFGGMTNGEVAEILGIAERTVKRDWQVARAWLYSRFRRRKSHAG